MVAVLSNGENDTGAVWEVGYAEGKDIPVIGFMPNGSGKYNLMPAMSVVANYTEPIKLLNMDLIDIDPNAWEREVE